MNKMVKTSHKNILVKSGAIFELYQFNKLHLIKIQTTEWAFCRNTFLNNHKYKFTVFLLVLISMLCIHGVHQIERKIETRFEQLKPLIAKLEPRVETTEGVQRTHKQIPYQPASKEKGTKDDLKANHPTDLTTRKQVKSPPKTKQKEKVDRPSAEERKSEHNQIVQNVSPKNQEQIQSETFGSGEQVGSPTGQGVDSEEWGVQHTALAKKAPLHFRQIGKTPEIWVAETEVTQRQWTAIMGLDLSAVSGHWEQAVDDISWCRALEFANRLSQKEKKEPVYRFRGACESGGKVIWDEKANGYRLLTEEEWVSLAEQAQSEVMISATNNRGVTTVYDNQTPQGDGLYGLRGNAGEWVWASSQETHSQRANAAAARNCVNDENCRVLGGQGIRILGIGFRLAQGPRTGSHRRNSRID